MNIYIYIYISWKVIKNENDCYNKKDGEQMQ